MANRFHEAAVMLRPTLDSLIAHLDAWDGEGEERDNAAVWLLANATTGQLRELFDVTLDRQPEDDDWLYPDLLIGDIVDAVAPRTLLHLWEDVISPLPSDLTDAEWRLVGPLLPRARGKDDTDLANMNRPRMNGFLYRYTKDVAWFQVPPRYYGDHEDHHSLMMAFYAWRKRNVFREMYEALLDNPDAARLTAWLRSITD